MDTTADAVAKKAQKLVVLYCSPGMGHLVSMVELGKLFASRGLAVNIVVIDPPYHTGATGAFLAGVSAANPLLSFHRLPHVTLPPVPSKHYEALTYERIRLSDPHFRDFLAAVTPDVLVLDFFCSIAIDAAAELGIATYFFFTSGSGILASFLHLPVWHAQTTASFQDLGDRLVPVPGIPSFPATHAILPLQDRDDKAYEFFLDTCVRLCDSNGIIINTVRSLEPRATDAVAAGLCTPPGRPTPPIYCIGPLLKTEEVVEKRGDECLAWLDTQPKSSVVFLCFGSIGRFSAEQIKQVAVGLDKSRQRFLWVVRSPPSNDPAKKYEEQPEPDLDVLLPQGFLDRTKDRGLVVKSWAPQRDVLAHGAVGGFVTHCGWNSVLEAVATGVPMLAWPLYAEQRMNAVFLVEELRLAVAVEGYDKEVVNAEEVVAKVRWLMESEGGKELRERTLEAMRRAKEAVSDGGESESTLARLVDGWKRA